ncbi:TIGR03557 family F420-dependent LLM class oxidoreductase [Actinophytocola algeriensis]|uniref:G6PDH family F420-dependent oxidoreductase n=1 Tax=Actinophytocola algeriensis TaxID=1768010 RepID=A0A7W7QES0_9PSEU|nr:TIGR03557 family F420-dependent LLM class oxidoreductase [Actinophytocola algeriensis]MBB4912159.1 G6PDH family F420-dependent oxidoreductase [Actinophytocola algeriensis]MBE1474325.1 G6PDH family F420-dependent oxidoreductase [Actinophytocola algeriensis]
MHRFGYTLMTEQAGPRALVRHAHEAERAGFDFEVMSDHYFPWLTEQGHASNAWATLGAVTQSTERVELMTYVTCPIMRYHPAVVAQQAATVQLLSGNRFTLGLGAGENLNEHVVGRGWPPVNVRHEMLVEAVEIISALFDGGHVNFAGDHFRVDSAKLWDLPDIRVPIAVAVSGDQSVHRFAPLADAMIAVEPEAGLCEEWDRTGKQGTRKIAQLPVCWDADRDAAITRAHEQFRWFAGGWKVNAELPGPAGFAAATQFVTKDDVADNIPCGDDPDAVAAAVKPFLDAGFTDVALVGIGGDHQDGFLAAAKERILPALRALSG